MQTTPSVGPQTSPELTSISELNRFDRVQVLVAAIQRLSLARSLEEIQEIVRTAGRRICGADGATFVLRDGERCFYADEDAISPLWKGQRFPIDRCISGWAMVNRTAVAIEDVMLDDRIPQEAYRPTFVRSLLMVPIRTLEPVGAIGNYWAHRHLPSDEEVELLSALADSTAVALENVRVLDELERRVAERTAQLAARTRELEETNASIRLLLEESNRSFAAARQLGETHLQSLRTLAHEVRTPLAGAQGILRLTLFGDGGIPEPLRTDLADIDAAVVETLAVVTRELEAARTDAGAVPVTLEPVDVAAELDGLRAMFRAFARPAAVALVVERPVSPLIGTTDRAVLGHLLRNLVGNALKFTDRGEVRVRASQEAEGAVTVSVADTGIGIARADLDRIFEEWERVEGAADGRPAGSGLGLPLVRRLAGAIGAQLRVTSEPGRGSTFSVTLPSGAPED